MLSTRFPRHSVIGICVSVHALIAYAYPAVPLAAADLDAEARAMLAANCFRCHGPEKQKGGLRLDTRQGLLAKGDSGTAGVPPGKPDASELIRRVSVKTAAVQMPPEGT